MDPTASKNAMRNFAMLEALLCLAGLFRPGLLLAQSREEQILFDDANRERTQRGLSPLKWDAQLAAAARQHAALMAQQNTLSHQLPGEAEPVARARQAGARFSVFAENVADGPSTGEIHQGWMNSPPHRKNMLDPQLNSVGIAVAVARDGQLFAVQDFSRAVVSLSLDDQESRVRAQLKARGLAISSDNVDARSACEHGLGQGANRRSTYMLRYTSADLDKLPDAMEQTIRSGRYHSAEVGACPPAQAGDFAGYQIAVLFYQ
jgi:Cysteine-rich secretory protein family